VLGRGLELFPPAQRRSVGKQEQREEAMQDRRQIVRDKVIYGGVAETGQHGTTMDCVVRNFSDQGACIELDRGTRLPDQVNLAVARKSRSYLAEVIWRQANMVGLAFRTMFTEPPESDLGVRLRRSEKKKRELQRRIKQLLDEG
jgi:PilZ domain